MPAVLPIGPLLAIERIKLAAVELLIADLGQGQADLHKRVPAAGQHLLEKLFACLKVAWKRRRARDSDFGMLSDFRFPFWDFSLFLRCSSVHLRSRAKSISEDAAKKHRSRSEGTERKRIVLKIRDVRVGWLRRRSARCCHAFLRSLR